MKSVKGYNDFFSLIKWLEVSNSFDSCVLLEDINVSQLLDLHIDLMKKEEEDVMLHGQIESREEFSALIDGMITT